MSFVTTQMDWIYEGVFSSDEDHCFACNSPIIGTLRPAKNLNHPLVYSHLSFHKCFSCGEHWAWFIWEN